MAHAADPIFDISTSFEDKSRIMLITLVHSPGTGTLQLPFFEGTQAFCAPTGETCSLETLEISIVNATNSPAEWVVFDWHMADGGLILKETNAAAPSWAIEAAFFHTVRRTPSCVLSALRA